MAGSTPSERRDRAQRSCEAEAVLNSVARDLACARRSDPVISAARSNGLSSGQPRPGLPHPIPSHSITSHPGPPQYTPSNPVPCRSIPPHPVQSRPVLSRLVPSRPIPSSPVPSRPAPPRPVASRRVASRRAPSRLMLTHFTPPRLDTLSRSPGCRSRRAGGGVQPRGLQMPTPKSLGTVGRRGTCMAVLRRRRRAGGSACSS